MYCLLDKILNLRKYIFILLLLVPVVSHSETISNSINMARVKIGMYVSSRDSEVARLNILKLYQNEIVHGKLLDYDTIKGDDELFAILKLLIDVLQFTQDGGVLSEIEKISDALLSRDFKCNEIKQLLYNAFVTSRSFEKAAILAAKNNKLELEYLPSVKRISSDARGRKIFNISKDENILTENVFTLGKGFSVIVISSPVCQFSRQAMIDISMDKELSGIFSSSGWWLFQPEWNLNFTSAHDLKVKHSNFNMGIIGNVSDWSDLNIMTTPVFYFFQDGRYVSSYRGWQGSDDVIALKKEINRAIGRHLVR